MQISKKEYSRQKLQGQRQWGKVVPGVQEKHQSHSGWNRMIHRSRTKNQERVSEMPF